MTDYQRTLDFLKSLGLRVRESDHSKTIIVEAEPVYNGFEKGVAEFHFTPNEDFSSLKVFK